MHCVNHCAHSPPNRARRLNDRARSGDLLPESRGPWFSGLPPGGHQSNWVVPFAVGTLAPKATVRWVICMHALSTIPRESCFLYHRRVLCHYSQ